MRKKTLISLEGNIGAGKSTFLKILQKNQNIKFTTIDEPVDEWQNIKCKNNQNVNLLELFYQDQQRWGYTFQSQAFFSRLKRQLEIQKKNNNQGIFVLERSIYSDKFIFAKNNYKNKIFTELEWAIYNQWFDHLTDDCQRFIYFHLIYLSIQTIFLNQQILYVRSHQIIKTLIKYNNILSKNLIYNSSQLDGIIYLQTDPNVCYERCKKRAREAEKLISKDYLIQLHSRHEEWLIQNESQRKNILILNCNQEFETNTDVQKILIEEIQQFVNKF